MITEEEKKEFGKMRFASEMESEIRGLDFQRNRIFEFSHNNGPEIPKPTHDADFYMVLLRRLYRCIEKEQHDSRVGNLKGKFNGIHKKIKIRDHYEHEINYKTFSHATSGIMIVGSVVINETDPLRNFQNFVSSVAPRGAYFKPLLRDFIRLMDVFPEYCHRPYRRLFEI